MDKPVFKGIFSFEFNYSALRFLETQMNFEKAYFASFFKI